MAHAFKFLLLSSHFVLALQVHSCIHSHRLLNKPFSFIRTKNICPKQTNKMKEEKMRSCCWDCDLSRKVCVITVFIRVYFFLVLAFCFIYLSLTGHNQFSQYRFYFSVTKRMETKIANLWLYTERKSVLFKFYSFIYL